MKKKDNQRRWRIELTEEQLRVAIEAIEVYETDSPMTVKIKEFMALYNIIDIKMRMLKVVELKRIQGFPDDYVLMGNQRDQKKFIGNAVHTSIPKVWCPALCRALQESPSNQPRIRNDHDV